MKILLVTDAWEPQMNGVVRTLQSTVAECRRVGHIVEIVSPADGFKTIPLPSYKQIRVALFSNTKVENRIADFAPDAIHIATEGPLGHAARKACLKWSMPFTTSYHTQFPEYAKARLPIIPLWFGYWVMRRFHNAGGGVMVTTASMRDHLHKRGLKNLRIWSRGVNMQKFNPQYRTPINGEEDVYKGMPRPILSYIGRVAVEKNIESFLKADLQGTKVIVGDGPALETLKRTYRKHNNIYFVGSQHDETLSRYFANADVMVFPSRTDTFGLVILEAIACGTPVAAYRVPGPMDILDGTQGGVADDDIAKAVRDCLLLDRKEVAKASLAYTWEKVAKDFVSYLKAEEPEKVVQRWRRTRRILRLASFPLRFPVRVVNRLLLRCWRFIRSIFQT